jgi:hypothetical protein
MFKFIQKLMGRTSSGNAAKPPVIRLCLEPEEMNEWQKTDVIINIINCPFATLTESKVPNVWYHHDERIDYLFALNARGFHWIRGSKAAMQKRGLLRHGV